MSDGDKSGIEQLIDSAIEDGRNRNYSSAVRKLKKALTLSDDYPRALLYLGRAYHALGCPDEAVIAFRMYISGNPESGAGYFFLGRTYLLMKRFRRASACFREAAEASPDFCPAHVYYGYSRLRIGDTEKALTEMQKAVELEPDNEKIYNMYLNTVLAYSVKKFRDEDAETALQGFQFLEKTGVTGVTTCIYTGLLYKSMEMYDEAARYIGEAVRLSPDDNILKNLLAEIYIKNARLDDAVELLGSYMSESECSSFLDSLENSAEIFAESFWQRGDYRNALHFALVSLKGKRTAAMHLLAGECLMNEGRLDDAWNHYARAGKIDRNIQEPRYGQAVICWLRKDYRAMLEITDTIDRINPEDGFAAYYGPLCRYRLGMPEAQWLPQMKKLLKKEQDPWLLTAVAYGSINENDYDSAEKYYRKAIKLDAEHREAWKGLIRIIRTEGNNAGLEKELKKYLGLFPDDRKIRKNLAAVLIKEEKYRKAVDELRILASDPEADNGVLKRLAFCYRKNGQFGDAGIIYRQLLREDPYNEKLLKILLYCMRRNGEEENTIPLLREAVKAFGREAGELMLVLGTTLYRSGRTEEAMNIFQKCIYEGRADWRVYRNMSIIYRKKGLSDWAEMYRKKYEASKKN